MARAPSVCVVCGDDDDAGDAHVRCARGHALCGGCFARHVATESGKNVSELQTREGEVRCPMSSAAIAAGERCDAVCYDSSVIASRAGKEAFEAYLRGKMRVMEARVVEDAEARLARERERMKSEAGADERLRVTREEVIERVFTCACPRCTQAFLDFSGCFALTCARCGAGICAYCLTDCGKDAHAHIGQCSIAKDVAKWQVKHDKEKARHMQATNRGHAVGTFGTSDMFDQAQRLRRIRHFAARSATWDDDFFKRVLASLEVELKDLGIAPNEIVKERAAAVKKNKAPPPKKAAPKAPAPRGRNRAVAGPAVPFPEIPDDDDDPDFLPGMGGALGLFRGINAGVINAAAAFFEREAQARRRGADEEEARRARMRERERNKQLQEAIRREERAALEKARRERRGRALEIERALLGDAHLEPVDMTKDEQKLQKSLRDKEQRDMELAIRLSMETAAKERNQERARRQAEFARRQAGPAMGSPARLVREGKKVVCVEDENQKKERPRSSKKLKAAVIDLT